MKWGARRASGVSHISLQQNMFNVCTYYIHVAVVPCHHYIISFWWTSCDWQNGLAWHASWHDLLSPEHKATKSFFWQTPYRFSLSTSTVWVSQQSGGGKITQWRRKQSEHNTTKKAKRKGEQSAVSSQSTTHHFQHHVLPPPPLPNSPIHICKYGQKPHSFLYARPHPSYHLSKAERHFQLQL